MATVITVNLYLSEYEMGIVTRNGLNILETCTDAVKKELQDRHEIEKMHESPISLHSQIRTLEMENELLRSAMMKKTVGCEVRVPAAELLKNL